jgi:hypothetical protein
MFEYCSMSDTSRQVKQEVGIGELVRIGENWLINRSTIVAVIKYRISIFCYFS